MDSYEETKLEVLSWLEINLVVELDCINPSHYPYHSIRTTTTAVSKFVQGSTGSWMRQILNHDDNQRDEHYHKT